jgi:hypothetical protein
MGMGDANHRHMRNAIRRTSHEEGSFGPEPNRAALWQRRASLFRGMYDHRPRTAKEGASGYRVLNGVCREPDPTSQRFAHIEIDDDRVTKK